MIAAELIENAAGMRAVGASWWKISKELCVHPVAIRRRFDTEFAKKQKEKERLESVARRAKGENHSRPHADCALTIVDDPRPPDHVLFEREAYLRQQHSDATGRMFGDPLPGRRAADRKPTRSRLERLKPRPYNVFILGVPRI